MVPWSTLKRVLLGREVAVVFALLAGLYLVRFIQFRPLQIPAYLLIVIYDLVEAAQPFLTPYHPIAFPLFLYLLALGGGAVARGVGSANGARGTMVHAAASVCLLLGSISLAFGLFVGGPLVAPADNPTPLAITGATGVVLLAVGWWLLGRPTGRLTVPE